MRINLDDDLLLDPRVIVLTEDVGKALSMGYLAWAYQIAEPFYFPERKPIPLKHFKMLKWSQHFFDAQLAEVTEDGQGVFIIRSEEQFSWRFKKSEAGKEGQIAKKLKKEQSEAESSSAKQCLSSDEECLNTGQQTQATDPDPCTDPDPNKLQNKELKANFSNSAPQQELIEIKTTKQQALAGRSTDLVLADQKLRGETARVIGCYVKAFEKKFEGARPDITGKVQGQIKNLLKSVAVERLINLVEVFFQIDDKWFNQKGYDWGTFETHMNKISVALHTGNQNGGNIDWDRVFGKPTMAVVS